MSPINFLSFSVSEPAFVLLMIETGPKHNSQKGRNYKRDIITFLQQTITFKI